MEINNNSVSCLVNIGNTCYINSSLQCLLHTKQLNAFSIPALKSIIIIQMSLY